MMKKIQYKFISLLVIVFLFTGCEKGWLDINDDPNNPTEANVSLLLSHAQYGIADYLGLGYMNFGYMTGVYVHQISTRESFDKYGVDAGDINYWVPFYARVNTDLDKIIETGLAMDYMEYVGIAKILKAYAFSQMVDIWGDIPFTEANVLGITNPVFDDDEAIYAALLVMIDEGVAALTAASLNTTSPGADDLIYGGDTDLWARAGRTLKLKLYNQVQNTGMYDAADVTTLLASDLIEDGGDFMMWYGAGNNPENRNPGMADEYSGVQISLYISPWFFEILMGANPDILTGIEDPRIPYYFCNQLEFGENENPAEYQWGTFNSIYFGSDGTNRDHAGRATFTMVGFYPCGGRYDDGLFEDQLGGVDAVGDAPMRFITYADRLFIEAELVMKKGVAGDASDLFEAAVIASFQLVDDIAAGSGTAQAIPALIDATATDAYFDAVEAAWIAGSAEEQFELLMTQKWIQSWGSEVDSYTDYRRTGYPRLFDPNDYYAGFTDGGPDGTGEVPVSLSRDYAIAFPYPNSELDLNPNAPAQRNITTDGIFWDI